MRKPISLIILFLIATLPSFSQRHQNNNDFYSYWKKENYKIIRDNSYKNLYHDESVSFIDSLKRAGVDSIGVYLKEFPHLFSKDSCDGYSNPSVAYVQWIREGRAYQKMFKKCCKYNTKEIHEAIIIRYYLNARDKIRKEFVLPVVTEIMRNKQGKIYSYISSVSGDIPYCEIYCCIKNEEVFRMIDESWTDDSENLFQKQNRESSLNSWINMTKKYVEEDD